MNRKRYYIDENIIEDSRSLVEKAKTELKRIALILTVYEKCSQVLYGIPPDCLNDLEKFQESSLNSLKQSIVSASPETTDKIHSTPKRSPYRVSSSGFINLKTSDIKTPDPNLQLSSSSSPKQGRVSTSYKEANQPSSTPLKRGPYGLSPTRLINLTSDVPSPAQNLQNISSDSPKQDAVSVNPETTKKYTLTPEKETVHGLPPIPLIDLTSDFQSCVSSLQQNTSRTPKQGRVLTNYETTTQADLIEIKNIRNAPNLQQNCFLFDSAEKETSQYVSRIPKQLQSPMKMISSVAELVAVTPQNSPPTTRQQTVIVCPQNQVTPARQQTVIVSPQKLLIPAKQKTVAVTPEMKAKANFNEVVDRCNLYLSNAAQCSKMAGKPEDMSKPDRLEGAIQTSTSSSIKVLGNLSPFKKVIFDRGPTSDDENNICPGKEAMTLDDLKSMGPENVSKRIQKMDEVSVSPKSLQGKKAKLSVISLSNAQESASSDDKPKLLIRSDQETNICLPPESGKLTDSGLKRRFPCPRTNTLQFSRMPRIIESSGVLGIEFDISYLSERITSPTSLVSYRRSKTLTDDKDKERFPKDLRAVSESKAGSSKDFGSLERCIVTSSPPVEANARNLTKDEVIKRLKYKLSNEPSTGSLQSMSCKSLESSGISLETGSSQGSDNLVMRSVKYFKTKLATLIGSRSACIRSIFKNMLDFQANLINLEIHLENILNIITDILDKKTHYFSKDLFSNIINLKSKALSLKNEMNLCKLHVERDLNFWANRIGQIDRIKLKYSHLLVEDVPSVTIEALQTYETKLNAEWEELDVTISTIDSRRLPFLTTAQNYEECIHLFIKCLITVGILKPSN